MPLLAVDNILELFANDPRRAQERYRAFVTGEDPPEHDDVRRWSEGPRTDRPPLSELLADDDSIECIRSAHLVWDYSMRAIASALGVNPSTISRRINGGGR
jgi:hypothetical protein